MTSGIQFEKVSFDDARRALDANLRGDADDGWEAKRAPQRSEPLHETTVRWMESLPRQVRPVTVAREFPRIANKLGEIWKRPARCDEYFQQLLIDHRGGRKGFPPAVSMELAQLATHYASVYPYRRSIWDDVLRK